MSFSTNLNVKLIFECHNLIYAIHHLVLIFNVKQDLPHIDTPIPLALQKHLPTITGLYSVSRLFNVHLHPHL